MSSNALMTQATASSHTIPIDLFLDAVRILLKNAIDWKVEGINEKESSLLIQVRIPTGNKRQQQALNNIQTLLEDYAYFTKEAADYSNNSFLDQLED